MALAVPVSNGFGADQYPFPAPAQVALALVVLKYKPAGTSVEEYLAHLREHVIPGNATASKITTQHLDGAAYWKQAYEKILEEKAALLDKLHQLEWQDTALTTLSSPLSRSPRIKGRKRGREDTPAAKANSRSKRRATSSKAVQSPTKESAGTEGNELTLPDRASAESARLLQSFFALRMHLRSQTPNLPAIQSSARQLCHIICAIIRSIEDKSESEKDGGEGYTNIWIALRRTYGSILEAMDLLYASTEHSGGAASLMSDLTTVLTGLLECLRALALREQPGRSHLQTSTQSHGESSPASRLTDLISGTMMDLDLNKEAHRELFEALAYTYFEHLGSNLSMMVFSDPLSLGQTLSSTALQPQNDLAGNGNAARSDCEQMVQVSPYLISILRRIRPLTDVLSEHQSLSPPKGGAASDGGCAAMIREKIQNTLLRGLFGDQDDVFHDTLKRPSVTESIDGVEGSMANKKEDITAGWFLGEVWDNVGWEILTHHIG